MGWGEKGEVRAALEAMSSVSDVWVWVEEEGLMWGEEGWLRVGLAVM